ncbi:hypothetical protein [Embleya sp. NBC_00896]|uniref:hypothetical protein n=1 Tax=Embleya sp. NBC_00896 TaxID=2975961 RepID=UPI002F9166B8|nr:hypothetical protein OG928_38350 [Embleya sp. NBC_00896]
MAAVEVPERLRWTVRLAGVRPDDQVLEIGCGRGVAIALVCELLGAQGRVVGLDRSPNWPRSTGCSPP